MTEPADGRLLSEARERLASHVPVLTGELKTSIERHEAQLAAIIENMETMGLDEEQIRVAIRTMLDAYEIELLAAIRTIREAGDAA